MLDVLRASKFLSDLSNQNSFCWMTLCKRVLKGFGPGRQLLHVSLNVFSSVALSLILSEQE